MRKLSIITLIFITALSNFIPFYKVEAATPYTVEMVSNTRSNAYVGSYSSYEDAVRAMERQNSSSTSVATVYKDGRAIDSEYAIFKFKPGGVYNLYRESNSYSAYTAVAGSYGVDAAFLGYSENGRVKIMISGFTGWTDINNGVITPISLLGVNGNMISVPGGKGIRIRTSPSTSASVITQVYTTTNFSYTETAQADGYTWYKVSYNGSDAWIAKTDSVTVLTGSTNLNTFYKVYGSSGNLIHYYDTYNGSGYTRSFSNLGTAPSWMPKEVVYYSFDGNYFYTTLEGMLEDYRNGTYEHSVNYNNPYYSYYLYLPSHSTTSYTASDLDSIIANKGYNASNSKMYGTGQYFKEAEATYGQNALMMFSHAATESAYGTSNIAMDKNNLFGYGAADSCAYDCAYSYDSPRDSIMDYAQKTGDRYNVVTGKYYYGSHFGNKSSGRNVKYMADPYAGEKEAAKSFLSDIDFGGKDFNSNTIGVTRKGLSGAWVFTRPEQVNDAYLYTLKNPTTNDPVYDIPANIVDKVVGIDGKTFYKVYTDLNPGDGPTYGYVEASEWNVSNNQPVINANDVTITEGANFDPMSGVSASDVENGDLTSKVTYESDVDSNKAGTYHVTYTVVDNSNFHASKEITVKVTSAELPTIDAENREVNQFEEFDYMTGVKATAYDGTDLTDSITYDKTVDTNVSGTYEVTYKVKDSKGKEASKTITVTVIPNEKPVINASDKEIYLNSEFDPLEGVTATDKEDGELKVEYEGEVKTDVIGNYEITYKATDKNGQVTTKTITVKVIANQLPVINASDKTIYLNSEFNPLEGVIATDEEDGKIDKIEVVKNDVKTDKEGKYEVTYSVTDSYNQTVTKTITVTVTEKVLVKKDGLFYVDYLDNVDGKLELKGYNTIKGIDNDLNQDIKYKITFKNVDNNQTYEQYATRIVDDNEIPFDVYSADGKNYKYSWFTIDFDLDKLPAGNYTATMTSIGEDYYSENVITNKTNSTEITGFNDENKYLVIRNNYNYNSSPIEFIVRDEKLADKTVSSYYNQFDNFITFEFNDDNTLHLRGMSYSYGMNLSSSANVTRKIIFENENNYKTYVKDLGSVTKGDYEAPLPVSDGLDKTRAWYDKNIDISDIPKGTYAIYITTSANVTDISEFTEKLGRSLDDVKATINGKKYSFDVNFSKNSRIEMKVE
mgnify:CR=1 FL=1